MLAVRQDAGLRLRGLRVSFGDEAVGREQPSGDGATQRQPRPQREDHAGSDRAGGAAPVLPFAVIGDVAHHRPQDRARESIRELAKHFRGDDDVSGVRRDHIQRRGEDAGQRSCWR